MLHVWIEVFFLFLFTPINNGDGYVYRSVFRLDETYVIKRGCSGVSADYRPTVPSSLTAVVKPAVESQGYDLRNN